jgi:hypothetical protein
MAVAATSLATTLRVPQDYPTIQAAFDSLSDGDTVLVMAGIYVEALRAPDYRSFVLLGEVSPDSLMPIVDPSLLDSSAHLACLILPSHSSADIAYFTFRNGPEMYPRNPPGSRGGIVDNSVSLTVQHCVFDSTFTGLYRNAGFGIVSVSECDFVLNQFGCIWVRTPSRVTITNCQFSAYFDRALWLQDSSVVESCDFRDMHSSSEWMWLEGRGIILRECTFGPTITPAYDIVWTDRSQGCLFEGNTFHDLEVTGQVIFFGGVPADTSYFRNNLFHRTRGTVAQSAGGGLAMMGQDSANRPRARLSNNIFDSCWAATTSGFGSVGTGRFNVMMDGNVFDGPMISRPNVHRFQSLADTFVRDNVIMHNSSFHQTGWALASDAAMSAELNWWGDPSGPHHSELNPEGLGDSITGQVGFEPWLHEDPLSSPSRRVPAPAEMAMEVFPNPFNATTTLSFTLTAKGKVELAVYDLLGREVKVLVKETRAAGEYRVMLDAGDWSSGIYLARLQTTRGTRTSKLLLLK